VSEIERSMYGEFGVAVRASTRLRRQVFLAWGCAGPTQGEGPLQEKNPVWFQFGETADEAVKKLQEELDFKASLR
jgi:hypothetical protein